MFNQAKHMLSHKQGFSFRNSSPYEIRFGGNTCFFASYGSEPKVGPAYKVIIYDEAFGVDRSFFEYMSLTTATYEDAKTILISTPRIKAGVFYDYFTAGENNEPNIVSYNWHELNKDNPEYINSIVPEELELQRRKMTPALFRSEFECQWQDSIGEVFGDVRNYVVLSTPPPEPIIIGIDPGSGNEGDYTCCAAMGMSGRVHDVAYCNTGGPSAQVKFCEDFIKRHHNVKIVVVEQNSIGAYVLDYVRKGFNNIQFIGHTWNHKGKNEDVEALRADLEFGVVCIPESPKLIEQMVAMKQEFRPDGTYTYNSPSPPGDDGIAAICHCNWCRRNHSGMGSYIIR